jgi:hypothetical protein
MRTLLPHDAALPQLATALDPHAMAKVFACALRPRANLHVQGCRVDRIKYRPRRNCTVSYVLTLHDREHDREREQRVAARFFGGGESARRFAKQAGKATVASSVGPGLLHLDALGMVAHWMPNDAKLPALRVLHDAARLCSRWLPDVVAELTCGRGRLVDHSTALVQYVPEARVCARVQLRLQSEAGTPVTTQTLYVKADNEGRGAATHAAMQALYGSAAQASGRLRTPRPVVWHSAVGLHWQLAVPGIALLDVDPQVSPAASARVGEQLAALHATPVPLSRVTTAATLREQPRRVAELLASVEPAWKPLLARLVRRLEEGAAALEREAPATLHGDLHPRNILVDGESYAFIDLDSLRKGPAVIELGAWVADVLYRGVLGRVAPRELAPSWRAFLAAHAAASGRAVHEPLLAWSTAHNLLCQRAYRCVANLKPGRFEAVPALLALAESIASAQTLDAAVSPELEAA